MVSRKQSRKQRQSRKQKQRQSRRQRQRNQRGGASPYDADYVALGGDVEAYKMAGVYGQNEANVVAQALANQKGGNHDELAPFKGGRRRQRKSRGRKSQRSQRNQRRQRSQRGGMADFNASSTLGFALPGVNDQFANENKVMGGWYNPTQGAQGPSVGR